MLLNSCIKVANLSYNIRGVDNFLVVGGLNKKIKCDHAHFHMTKKTTTDSVPIIIYMSIIVIEFILRNNSGMNIFGPLI